MNFFLLFSVLSFNLCIFNADGPPQEKRLRLSCGLVNESSSLCDEMLEVDSDKFLGNNLFSQDFFEPTGQLPSKRSRSSQNIDPFFSPFKPQETCHNGSDIQLALALSLLDIDDDRVGIPSPVVHVPVLVQSGLTCGQHAIKNVELGILYGLTNCLMFKNLMNDPHYLQHRFLQVDQNSACDETYLKESDLICALQSSGIPDESAARCFAKMTNGVIAIVDTWESYEQMKKNQDVKTMVELSYDDCVVGFVVNLNGTSTPQGNVDTLYAVHSHWVAYVVKKEQGKIASILCFDSLGSSRQNPWTLENLCKFAYQKPEVVQGLICQKNIINWYEDCKNRFNGEEAVRLKSSVVRAQELGERVKTGVFETFLETGDMLQQKLTKDETRLLLRIIKEQDLLGENYQTFEAGVNGSLEVGGGGSK